MQNVAEEKLGQSPHSKLNFLGLIMCIHTQQNLHEQHEPIC